MITETRYFKANGKTWTIYYDPEKGYWQDIYGCIYGLRDDSKSVDNINRCGLGMFTLPEGHPANDFCAKHDFAYECPAYQLFNDRSVPDSTLRDDLIRGGYPLLGRLFYPFIRLFGGRFWERDESR